MTADGNGVLVRLNDTGQTIADPADDIRGRTVLDRDGEEVGHVADLLVDQAEHRVRLLRVEHGGLLGIGATPVFIPADAIVTVSADEIRIDPSRRQVAGAPVYTPELVDERAYFTDLYGYYGYLPFWGSIPPGPGRPPL